MMRFPELQRARVLRQRRAWAFFLAATNAVAWAIGGGFGSVAFTIATAVNIAVWTVAINATSDELRQIEGRGGDWPRLN